MGTALFGLASTGALAQGAIDEGQKLFTQAAVPACAVCHTLRHAGANGEVGPDLDELRPDASRVEKAVRTGIGQMPAFTGLTDAQVKLLANYVSTVAGAGR
ncbi:c-type cytochrome [Noviherbaspirillum massiliense]|uniref:SorU family sulfite dehydrogenase c-type cytochrome subunit n=1 Tax=Noviherbaspirillum massiliense TaxID=1465823 RepID=UPI00036EDB72|nr:cytochrome c [Noviherbaspirillum massiliense]